MGGSRRTGWHPPRESEARRDVGHARGDPAVAPEATSPGPTSAAVHKEAVTEGNSQVPELKLGQTAHVGKPGARGSEPGGRIHSGAEPVRNDTNSSLRREQGHLIPKARGIVSELREKDTRNSPLPMAGEYPRPCIADLRENGLVPVKREETELTSAAREGEAGTPYNPRTGPARGEGYSMGRESRPEPAVSNTETDGGEA